MSQMRRTQWVPKIAMSCCAFCFVWGCSDENPVAPNNPPTIETLAVVSGEGIEHSPGPQSVAVGETLALACAAFDPDGDPLVVTWQANAGTFDRTDSVCVQWTAPDSAANVVLVVVVSDGEAAVADSLLFDVTLAQQSENYPTLLWPSPDEVLDNGCFSQTDSLVWEFGWGSVPGATMYHLYIRGDNAGGPVVNISSITDTVYRRASIAYVVESNRHNWRWRVRARVDGQWTAWSSERVFHVEPLNTDCAETDVVTLISPVTGAILDNGCTNGADPIQWDFAWQPLPGATRYHLYVIGPGAIYPLIDNATLTNTSYHRNSTGGYIVDGNRIGWSWRVRALVNDEWTAWSERTFNVEPLNTDCSTDTVLLSRPKNGWYMDNGCPDGYDGLSWRFEWINMPRATNYHVWVGTAGGDVLINDSNVIGASFDYDAPGSYIATGNINQILWRVRAKTDDLWTSWSETRSFRIEPEGLDCGGGPVVPISPPPGAVLDNGCTDHSDPIQWDFSWAPVPGATRYQLWIIGETAVIPVVSSQNVYGTSYQHISYGYIVQRDSRNWCWQVRALVNGQWTKWSDHRFFDVEPVNTDCGGL